MRCIRREHRVDFNLLQVQAVRKIKQNDFNASDMNIEQ